MGKFNEDSRVKIPALLHLCKLGYEYMPLRESEWDKNTNIFTEILVNSMQKINPEMDEERVKRLLIETSLLLDNEDLGKAFFEKLINESGTKLIDFDNFSNNSFHVVTELPYKNGDDEFRPDITILVNGMPLVFIEVKKPHNRDGIIAERNRINRRFQNSNFKRFVNATQFMIFSNNMEYDDEDIEPLHGAFYSSTSYHKASFNYFREEEEFDLSKTLLPVSDEIENKILMFRS